MPAPSDAPLLRPGLLDGLDVVLAGAPEAVGEALAALGADVHELTADPLDEEAVGAAAGSLPHATFVVADASAAMRAAGGDDGAGLRDAVAAAWNVARALVVAHLEPSGFGKVVLVAPRPRDGAGAAAAGAALENLARTTGVEWARLGIRVVAVRPRDSTNDAALAQVLAFVASPAGDYFSGTALDLGAALSR